MGTTGFIIVMSILAIASVTAAIIRNRNFRKKEKLLEGLGETYGLSLAYASERSFTLFADLDQPSFVRHDLGEWLQITTNDLLFASLILSDDIKISLYDTFNKIDAGLVYIEDEELAFIFPELLTDPEQVASIEKMIQLIVDIKDELNR